MRIAPRIGLPLVLLLQGCSRQEYFVVTNETAADITIAYEIDLPAEGFPIFNDAPRVYNLQPDGSIRWDSTAVILDLDTARSRIMYILHPNKGLMIGSLSNDTYTGHDQYFINGRHFNLKSMEIQSGGTTTRITPDDFDTQFMDEGNVIIHHVK